MFITRTIVRWGLVGAVALGAATWLIGPEYVSAGIASIRGKARNAMDKMVSDPVALRRQLEGLARQYPDRIAEVRGETASVEHQLAQFNRDVEISQRVVAMTTRDLTELKALVDRAETSVKATAQPVVIRYGGVKFNLDEAYTEASRINTVRGTYQDRLAHDQQQITFLTQQKQRLDEILGKLESEFNTFQAQLWQLDRQIEAVARNERLIELTEQQQATLATYEKFGKVGSLKQLEAKLAELRTKQEAQLQWLSKQGVSKDYENRAQWEIEAGKASNPFDGLPADQKDVNDENAAPEGKPSRTLAFAEPVVIE